MEREDLYAVLDLNNECTQGDLRLSYKNLVLVRFHISSLLLLFLSECDLIFLNNFVCFFLYVWWCRNGIQIGFLKK